MGQVGWAEGLTLLAFSNMPKATTQTAYGVARAEMALAIISMNMVATINVSGKT